MGSVEGKWKMEDLKFKIGGIIQKRNLAKIGILSIPDRPGVAGMIFSALGTKGISCPFIVHNIDLNDLDNIVLCVPRNCLPAALEVLEMIKKTVGAKEVIYDQEVGVVSVFGPHFGERAGVAGVMFSALASVGINILAISTSISSLSCLINASEMDSAIQALQGAFEQP
jgi:aspartate kinase